ncbi:MAG: hypothetical protein IT367_21555 [Candidatus Hydrogenedentes bacterium]|nr:hypothetical protein [Candidatus Hydrogenedentota bacterium]
MSDEYWLISVPGRSAPRQRYEEICQVTGRDQLSQNYLFQIPDLKVKKINDESCFHLIIDVFRSERWIH